MTKILAVEYPATQFTPGGSLPVISSGGTVVADADVDTILERAKRWGVHVHEVTAQDILTIPSDPVVGPVVSGGGVSQSDLDAAVALLQDKATAATDTELANAVATLNSALAAKQDASSAATDTELAAALVGLSGSEVAASILAATFSVTNAFTAIPNWQIVVPANSGAIEVAVPEGVLFNINTGTNPAGTKFQFETKIVDEAGAMVAYNQKAIYSSAAVAQVWVDTIPLGRSIANNPAAKTYSVQAKMGLTGTNAASCTIFTAQSGFINPTLRATRR